MTGNAFHRSASSSSKPSLEKVKKLAATTVAVSLTNQFFYKHFLSVNSTPFNANLFKGPTVSQNIFSGVLYRVETANAFWWSDNQMDIVQHGSSPVYSNKYWRWR